MNLADALPVQVFEAPWKLRSYWGEAIDVDALLGDIVVVNFIQI